MAFMNFRDVGKACALTVAWLTRVQPCFANSAKNFCWVGALNLTIALLTGSGSLKRGQKWAAPRIT